jgi:SAM-dependent methyltransferase
MTMLGYEDIFTGICRRNAWKGTVSVSGTGSDLGQTARIAAALPILFQRFQVRSVLDLACGDFYWMSRVDLRGVSYLGVDIVRALVEHNQRYARDGVAFRHLDLIADPLPQAHLVVCRDCLVHLPFADVLRALHNICRSGSGLLLTTTFPARRRNLDIVTGQWRTLNLELEPFNLPAPVLVLEEGCTENEGIYADKSLGLWRVSDVKVSLSGREN